MREHLAEKFDIETLMFEYERADLDQSVLRSVSPTPTACCYFDSSESSATPSPPYSPPSQWEGEDSEPFLQMSPPWGSPDSDSCLCVGDNDPQTRRRG